MAFNSSSMLLMRVLSSSSRHQKISDAARHQEAALAKRVETPADTDTVLVKSLLAITSSALDTCRP